MGEKPVSCVTAIDGWSDLRARSPARIALGRAGPGLPTTAHLAFQAAHAEARDAVHRPLDWDGLATALAADGWTNLRLESQVTDRTAYLLRPDLGRILSDASVAELSEARASGGILLLIADGLSSAAVESNVRPLLSTLRPLLPDGGQNHPLLLAQGARVALGDHAGELLGARLVIVLIGERPGLSAADSLGLYLTYAPCRGRVDAERNCISNIRPGGLSPADAARQAARLVGEMLRQERSGVALMPPGRAAQTLD